MSNDINRLLRSLNSKMDRDRREKHSEKVKCNYDPNALEKINNRLDEIISRVGFLLILAVTVMIWFLIFKIIS